MLDLTTSVQFVKGIGPRFAEILLDKGISTVEDLLYYLPFRYEDRLNPRGIGELRVGEMASVIAEVRTFGLFRTRRMPIFQMTVGQGRDTLNCVWFNATYLKDKFRAGMLLALYGKVEAGDRGGHRFEILQPQYEILHDPTEQQGTGEEKKWQSLEVGRIVPIYEAIGAFGSRQIRRAMYAAVQSLSENGNVPEILPAELRARLQFPPRRDALIHVHFPEPDESLDALNAFCAPSQQRLIFEEFFLYQLSLALDRRAVRKENAIPFKLREDRIREAVKRILPFKPTNAQKRVVKEIADDLEKPAPMNRLLQGDVGSGKTIVALQAAVIAIENGCQAALMAPTEILAVQHFLSARRVLAPGNYRVELLISGMKHAEKSAALERIRSGEAQLVVGTHALIEDQVQFARLGFAAIDEQHRFGVLQRKRLMDKAAAHGHAPHVLVLTATPIPRTLSLTLYGDLDVSILDELPPGRTPIQTRLTSEPHLKGVWDFVGREVAASHQAYIVYPVIEESKLELKAAMEEYERLSKTVFPKLKLGLLHGRLSSEEKDDVMQRFRKNEIQILVSTTVIEVGVDVPNATVMVIEHAERFGLAQLHQLRGRIGRGAAKSHCILVGPMRMTDDAQARLQAMVETNDGFQIAETDLNLRGPGEFFGTRQSGDLGFHIANPLRDKSVLEQARREAFQLVEDAAQSAQLKRTLAQLPAEWQRRYHLARIG